MKRLWPDTLAGRTILVLLAGLVAFHLFSLWFYSAGVELAVGLTRDRQVSERLASVKHALADLPANERDRAAHSLSSASLDMHWGPEPTVKRDGEENERLRALRGRLRELMPELTDEAQMLRLGYAEDQGARGADAEAFRHLLIGSIELADNTWMNFSAALLRPGPSDDHGTLISTTTMAFGIILLSTLVVRSINRPLRDLALAADRVGQDEGGAPPLPESGPREVRHAARAFNDMQRRIAKLIASRTQALAAVSHDLKTPITRIRLRAGFIDDPEISRQIDVDLDEMEAMVGSILAYLRGETESESFKQFDVATLLETLCNHAADSGHAVCYFGPRHLAMRCRPLALKRAFANLIDNAWKHGEAADVTLTADKGRVIVTIADHGPGIPEAEQEHVFEPFVRLDASRSRESGGSGLGLTIARQGIHAHGGQIRFVNSPTGGLIATVDLPLNDVSAPSADKNSDRRPAAKGLSAFVSRHF